MNWKEVRIGNFIHHINKGNFKVLKSHFVTGVISYSDGILLTKKMLLENGAELFSGDLGYCLECADGVYPNSKVYILWDEERNECYLDTEFEYIIKRNIKYVHQLQNIYFGLKDKEINFKP